MKTLELTWICDERNCEHETSVRHVRGSGVYCPECAAKRVRNSFDSEAEERDQQSATANARREVPQSDEVTCE